MKLETVSVRLAGTGDVKDIYDYSQVVKDGWVKISTHLAGGAELETLAF